MCKKIASKKKERRRGVKNKNAELDEREIYVLNVLPY
jgi:hypothetical protein